MLTANAVVGIGASAGGLNALQLMLAQLPAETGLAYVVVQHLAPEQSSILATLLQRVTCLPVLQVTQGLQLLADHLYVNTPNHALTIVDGRCVLTPPSQPHASGCRLIYSFARSPATSGIKPLVCCYREWGRMAQPD